MKVLYVGDLCPEGTCFQRLEAFQRLGLEVRGFDIAHSLAAGGPFLRRLRRRTYAGPVVDEVNADLLAEADALRPDLIWFDKPIYIRPATLDALRGGNMLLVNYICDNPFGIDIDPGWGLIRKSIPCYDAVVLPRVSSMEDFARHGARRTLLMPFAFDPAGNVPPVPHPAEKTVPLSFIGSPRDRRARDLRALAARDVPILVRGTHWRRHLPFPVRNIRIEGPAYRDEYRFAIWRSAIAFSFVTHQNADPYAHKAFEITACGTFLLAEGTEGHRALCYEGREAEFYTSLDEAADKAKFYIRSPEARETIARLLVGEEDPVAITLRQLPPRRVDVVAERYCDVAQVLAMPCGRPGGNGAFANRERRIGHHRSFSSVVDASEPVTRRAGALRRIR